MPPPVVPAEFPETVLLVRVIVSPLKLKMPPPLKYVVFPETVLSVRVTVPLLPL